MVRIGLTGRQRLPISATGRERGRRRAQCKWGRHSCRPHSHQRVATLYLARHLADLPPRWLQRILGARCLTPACPVLRLAHSGFRHRRSRRHPAFAPALPRPIRWPKPPCVRCPSTRWAEVAFLSRSVALRVGGFRRFHCAPFRPGSRPVRCHRLSPPTLSRQLALGRGLPHAVSSLGRGQMSPPSLGIKPPELQAFRLSVPRASRPEDSWKVRLIRRSDNRLSRDFSTSRAIACGREWINQRFVAFVAKRKGRQ